MNYLEEYNYLKNICSNADLSGKSSDMSTISAKISLAQICVAIGKEKYSEAILLLEQVGSAFEDCSLLSENATDSIDETYNFILEKLSSLYSVTNEHKKSIDLSIKLISNLSKIHTQKYGDIYSLDNLDFDEAVVSRMISRYLGIGASYIRLGEHAQAKRYLEKGYFLAQTRFGDQAEQTLKLNYNLALNEMIGIDSVEGLRQLEFVYKDMQEYLGVENSYTQIAKKMLQGLKDKSL